MIGLRRRFYKIGMLRVLRNWADRAECDLVELQAIIFKH